MKSTSYTRSPHVSASPETRERAEQYGGTQTFWHRVVQAPDLLCGRHIRALPARSGRRPSGAWRARNDAVVHGVGEHLRQPGVQGVDVGVRQTLHSQLSGPRLTCDGRTADSGIGPNAATMRAR